MSPLPLAAAAENREASPIALVLVLLLLVALIFLIRSMNKHLRKVPDSFSRGESSRGESSRGETPAEPAVGPGPGADNDPTDRSP
jgi:hypothetical protein